MANTEALQWELYGAGSAVAFTALRDEAGYGIQLRRDNALLVSDVAADMTTLLRKSSDLRHHLVRLGFATQCPAAVDTVADGEVAGALFAPSMLRALGNDLLLQTRS